jgi:hypothetical protein
MLLACAHRGNSSDAPSHRVGGQAAGGGEAPTAMAIPCRDRRSARPEAFICAARESSA